MSVDAAETALLTGAHERERVLEELTQSSRFLLVTHENPDGDALGSLVAMRAGLTALGKDAMMLIAPDELPLPHEYDFLSLAGLVTSPPEDAAERTLIFLDCGNIDRNPAESLKRPGAHILNVDHHHDNTRFGSVDLVVAEASCTAEIVWDLLRGLELELTPAIAEALYVGLVTDTGKFMYENTGARAHLMAAELIAAGVDVHAVYRRLYEGVPQGKLELLARGLRNVERHDGGRLTMTRLTRQDFAAASAEENYSEGIIDHLRGVEGTLLAALVRDKLGAPAPAKKVSLRSGGDAVDVSRIARAHGGGGHRQAAGFTTGLEWPALVAELRAALAEQVG